MVFCIFVVSVVTSLFSFLVLLILALYVFFLMSWLKVYFVYLFKALAFNFIHLFYCSISFISSLSFMIYFSLLTLGFVCSSFSSFFRYMIRLFIWDFSCFLRLDCIAINFLHRIELHSIGFGSSCSHFHLSPGIFCYLVTYCLSFMCLCFL